MASMTTCATAALLGALAAPSLAQTFVDDVAFLDRAARGEIILGNVRGSIGVLDYDNDGFMDLLIAQNAAVSDRLFHNVPSSTAPGGRTFVDVTAGAGLGDADALSRGAGGVAVLDYNNDGFSDLFLAGGGPSSTAGLLFRNNGNGTFSNTSIAAGVRLTGVIPDSISAVDFNLDGFVDLFVAATGSPGKTLTLLVNNGNGTFSERPDLLPSVSFTGRIYCHAWSDYDDDGYPDALICLSTSSPLTLRNVPNPSGGRMLVDATVASGFTTIGPAPMGIAVGDYDGDGDRDLAITDAVSGTYFQNNNGVFQRFTPFATFFGWGSVWIDADNDGRLDNYQAGSFSNANTDHLRLNKGGGVWTDARPALNTTPLASQYCARVDFDNDGRDDLITVNPNNFVSVYHNQSRTLNHWSKVRIVGNGTTSRDAVGAVVRLTSGGVTQVREIQIGSSYSASEDPRAHFGLGAATQISHIEVLWPRAGTIAERTQRFEGPFSPDTIITLNAGAPPCTGDADGNGLVSFADITAVLTWFGSSTAPFSRGDADGNGQVSFADITTVLNRFNSTCG